MKDKEWIEQRFYISYECRFCGKRINEKDLEKHQDECKE